MAITYPLRELIRSDRNRRSDSSSAKSTCPCQRFSFRFCVGLGSKFGGIPLPMVQLAVRHVHYSGKWLRLCLSSGRAVSVKFHPKRGDHFGRAIGVASNWHGAFRSFDHGLSVIGGWEKSRQQVVRRQTILKISGGINARHGRSTNEADCCVVYEV
jgi:hypothetical protein